MKLVGQVKQLVFGFATVFLPPGKLSSLEKLSELLTSWIFFNLWGNTFGPSMSFHCPAVILAVEIVEMICRVTPDL